MSKKMLINATHTEENRVATVEDGILTELDIESEGREMTRGNIYKATVVRVEPGLQAAFIDYGAERLGFLQMGELHPSLYKAFEAQNEGKGRARINDLLRRGQDLLVQVVKEERGTKGAALTTYLSLPGRYMVLMPESDTRGVSRKIEEEGQRRTLKEAMASLNLPAHMGYIVRTAGIGQSAEELKRDFDYLVRVWENIQHLSKKANSPALLYKESNLVIRSIRDYFTFDMDEVLVDDPEVFEEARDFFQQVMPEYARLVKLHQERRPIFARYQIEEQIETLSRNKVGLPSGGSIVIDVTEALVAIDVNSGKLAGEQGVEGTAYKSNLEAAVEVGRQLRLRDLGGLIVIDFIDMRDRKHIREIEKTLKDSLKNDKARVTVGRISQFGLLEMSRQRIKAALAEGSYLPCPNCSGTGRIKSSEAQAVAFLRKLQAAVARGQVERIDGEIPIDVAHYLLNTKREELMEMEKRYQVSIFLRARKSFVAGQYELHAHKRDKDEQKTEAWEPVTGATPALQPEATAAEEPAPAAAAAADQEGAAEEGTGQRKKRRRRRRKKKPAAAEGQEAAAAAESPQPEKPEGDARPEPQAPTGEELPAAAAQSPAADESAGPAEKPKRKPRRRSRKKTEEPAAAAAAESGGEPAAALAGGGEEPAAAREATAEAPAGDTEKPARKPARRRGTRKKDEAPAAAAEQAGTKSEPAPSAATLSESKPETGPEVKPDTTPEPNPEAKPARSRRRTTKTDRPAEPPADVPADPSSTPPTEAPGAEEKTKPAPRRRRTPAQKEPASVPAQQQTGEDAPVESAAPAKPRKPAASRRKTPAPKKTGDTAPTSAEKSESGDTAAAPHPAAEPETQPQAAPPGKPGAEKPAAATAGVKKPAVAKKAAAKKTTSTKGEAGEKTGDGSDRGKSTSRPSRAKTTKTAAAPQDSASQEAASAAAEAPKKKTSRSRKTAAGKEAEPAAADKPAPKKRAAPRKKKSEAEAGSENESGST